MPAQSTVVVRLGIRLLRTGRMLRGFSRRRVMMMRAATGMVMGHLQVAADMLVGVLLMGMAVPPHAHDRIDRHEGNRNEGDQDSKATGHGELCRK